MGEEARGHAQRKGSALSGKKIRSILINSPSDKTSYLTSPHSLIISLIPEGFLSGSCFPVLFLFLLTASSKSVHSNLCPSETYQYARDCLAACASLQVEKDLSESPDGVSKVDAVSFNMKRRE